MSVRKISIIGSGRLGSFTGYEIVYRELAKEVVLIDIIQNLPQGEAMDLNQMASEKGKSVLVKGSNDYKDISDSDIVVITAGFARKPGMTRLDLLKQNAPIVRDVALQIAKYAPNSIVITVTNPMDVMTYITYKITGFPKERVIGMGGQLDSARYREILANIFNVSRNSVKALVIGEHGENMLPLARFSYVGGIRVSDLLSLEKIKEAEEATRKIAAEVIALKGATVFAPVSCIASLIEAIVKDTKEIIPVSAYLNGEYGLNDLCIGVPAVIGKKGIEKIFELNLNEEEKLRFYKGAEIIKNAINELRQLAII
jgi:malate dehydrogenase (NAD) (EC 1.1.1.37)